VFGGSVVGFSDLFFFFFFEKYPINFICWGVLQDYQEYHVWQRK